MSDVNKQLLDALKGVTLTQEDIDMGRAVGDEQHATARQAIAAAEQAQQAEPVTTDPAVAAIQFALETHSDGLNFLRLWNEGEFDLLRREWPEAPEDIYIGADPLLEATAQPPAVAGAVPDERAAFEAWLQENIDDTDTVRPKKEKVDAYLAVWLARSMLDVTKP